MPRIRSTAPPATGRPDVPAGLERLLAQAMAKDPAHRPASALELARALQAVEQQQRLARTPIVVLDEQGHTTLVSQTQGSPTGRGGDDEDRTRIKAPQTVVAQPVGPSPTTADGETRRRSEAGGQRWSPAPMPSPSRATPAGTRSSRCRNRPGDEPDRAARLGSSGSSDSSEEATVRRAASTGDAQALPAPVPASASPLARPAVLVGLVAGVVVLVGLVVFLVVRPGSGDPAPAVPKPSATVSMPGDDSAIGDGVFDKPSRLGAVGPGQRQFHVELPAAHEEGHLPGLLRPHPVRRREPRARQARLGPDEELHGQGTQGHEGVRDRGRGAFGPGLTGLRRPVRDRAVRRGDAGPVTPAGTAPASA